MSYEKFVELLEKRLREALPEEWDICIRTVIKNNGRERKGIVIREPGLNISPTIYLEGYFERYQRGYTLEEIGCQIKELYQHVKVTHRWEGGFLTEYENVRSRIIYRVVNCRKNQDYLRGIPYGPFLDLAVIFFVMLDLDGEDKTAFMPVGEEHLRLWNVKKEDVYREACQNTPRLLPAEFAPMQTVIYEMAGEEGPEEWEQGEEDVHILTNSSRNFGAAAILYPSCLKRIGEYLGKDFYIMPSSIHEVIILPVSMAPSWEELDLIVREMNQTQLDREDVLSDRVYFYCREKEKLMLPEKE